MGLVERKANSTWARFERGSGLFMNQFTVCFNPACSLHRMLLLLLLKAALLDWLCNWGTQGAFDTSKSRFWLGARHWINRVWRHYRSLSFLFQTPAGDARALLSSGGILWWQERCSPWQQGHHHLPAAGSLAAIHPQIHVPWDEGEAGALRLVGTHTVLLLFTGVLHFFM